MSSPGTSPATALRGSLAMRSGPLEPLRTLAVRLVRKACEGRTRPEAAAYLGISTSTLQTLLREDME